MNPTNSVNILLVEDNPNDRELTLRALKKGDLSHGVQMVRDGAEALDFLFGTGSHAERAGARNPKVVWLDLKLPKVSGLDVLKKLKSDPRTRTIPVVILTSSQQERDIAESYALGANSYVVKPVDFAKFAKAIVDMGMYWLQDNQTPL